MDLLELDDDEEIVNDDGFVYIHKKARLNPTTTPTTSSAPPPPDPSIADENRRKRKNKALIKLKDKYQKELSQWEDLSNTLKDMQLKSQTLNQTRQEHAPPLSPEFNDSVSDEKGLSGRILDELLVKVDAQEEIIQGVSKVCDIAEELFNAEEERLKQSLIELPVWDYSPRELMASLCEE